MPRGKGSLVNPATDFKIVQGKGATAMFGTELYWLGSHRYLEERGLETLKVHRELEAMAGKGRTVVLVGDNKHVCGLIGLGDEVRLESKAMVARLRSAGIEHVVMLTGDKSGARRPVSWPSSRFSVSRTKRTTAPAKLANNNERSE